MTAPVVKVHGELLSFRCPGCGSTHSLNLDRCSRPCWSWNGSSTSPTISPSVLVRWGIDFSLCCHSFVRDGQIQFLSDCTHSLAGKTVQLEPIDA